MRLLLVTASPRIESSTRRLAEQALAHLRRAHADVFVDDLWLARDAAEPFRGFEALYTDATRAVVQRVLDADALLLASPVYNGSYSSALKNLFEHVDYKAIRGRAVAFALVASGQISFLQARSHLDALTNYFALRVVPGGVYATEAQVAEGLPQRIVTRLERHVDHLVALAGTAFPGAGAPARGRGGASA